MEPQRRELLAQCQQSLAQAMTEVEAVLGLLEAAGALSPGERRQLDEEAGGAKAELLLKLLLAKERDHFQDLRAALEKTQPHLLPILYLNGVVGPPQPAEGAGSTYSVLSIMPSDSESSGSLSSVGTTGKAPSPPPLLTDRQVNEKVENLSIQLQLMTRERNELRKRLAFATHGTTFDKRSINDLCLVLRNDVRTANPDPGDGFYESMALSQMSQGRRSEDTGSRAGVSQLRPVGQMWPTACFL